MEPLQMNEKMVPELPENWVWTTLGGCVDILDRKRVPINAKERDERKGNIPYYGATGQVGWIDEYLFDEELVLLGEDGAPFFDLTKNTAYIIRGKSWVNNHAHVLRAIFGVTLNQFLCNYLNNFNYQGYVTGTTRHKLNQSQMRIIPLPLPPLPEQHRIVTKIEELFTQLGAGVGALTNTKAQLKHYRQSVLKSACEGRLVPIEAELARAEGRDYEPADVLLARIGKERREKWDTEKKRKGKKSAKYKEPAAPDVSDLPELPEGWVLASIGQATECIDHMRIPVNKKERAKRIGDIPYYGANGQVDWIDDYLFDESLVLIVEDETFIGREKPFCYKITGKSWVNNHVHVLRATNAVDVNYLNYSLMYYPFTPLTTGTTGRRKLTKSALMGAPYSLPPLAEQHRIVAEIERRLSVADETEKTIDQSLKQAERLRQSILKRAFEGKLVPQDPNDEPASVLLEQILLQKG